VENWKIKFDSTGKHVFSAGEMGNLTKFEVESAEIKDTIRT